MKSFLSATLLASMVMFSCSKSDQLIERLRNKFEKIEVVENTEKELNIIIFTSDELAREDFKNIIDKTIDVLPTVSEKQKFYGEIMYDNYEWETSSTKIVAEISQNTAGVIDKDDELQKGVYKLHLWLTNK
jgi:hypothetical protein